MTRFDYIAKDPVSWVILSLALVLMPHAPRLPAWTLFVIPLLFLWRLAAIKKPQRLPRKWLLFIIVILSSFAMLVHYGTLFGKTAGTAILAVLLAVKLLESRKRRDYMLLIALSFFIIVTNFLFSQDIPTLAFMLITVVILVMSLIYINQESAPLKLRQRFKMSLTIVLQALPMMLVMFILFPRISGPLWQLPDDAHTARSGLSDTMSPGNIAQLINSNDIAFRVKFENQQPSQNQLYWRAHVLWYFDGRSWEQGKLNPNPDPVLETFNAPVEYTVTLEPHFKKWLFALDMPGEAPVKSHYNNNYLLRADKKITSLYQYQATSFLNYRAGNILSPWEESAGLKLPVHQNPRTVALGRQWRKQFNQPVDIVAHALKQFNQQNYVYTLRPPLTPGHDSVDQFLFNTRRGFCEHYAGSFAVLMRAAGIPTRIILGYQGGAFNPLNDVLTVRQSDAHAWTEVWLENQGWVRIDPTAAIAPSRIEQNLNAALPKNETRPLHMHLDMGVLKQLRFYWELMDNNWNQWVIAYDPELQQEFLSSLLNKKINFADIVYLLVFTLTIVTLAIAVMILKPFQRTTSDPTQLAYEQFCRKLARSGICREPCEGPVDFSLRAMQAHPQQKDSIKLISRIYINLRFRSSNNKKQLEKLRHLIRKLKL
ncbi:MAG: DUF3488 and transglutaminase-like domain-containing protein [Gammaproteobacteria bacterium]|nr:DUF3488 and transglutaminase-like domain-containing protein [Gammaproteobacteria bacterium]